ncbi:MAG TPA: hypothetical protein VN515_02085 [Terriglobales bacterium]|nr:hypothetical protein [Terriglobales bacterium]
MTTLASGSSSTREHPEDRILAVVRGRLRVMLEPHAAALSTAPVPAWLRASDALTIPAGTAYTIEALQDTEIYVYDARPAAAALWGV